MNKKLVIKAEDELISALRNNDVVGFESKLHTDLFFRIPTGDIVGKLDHTESMKTGDLKVESLTVRDQEIKIIDDIAMVAVFKDMIGSYKDSPFEGSFQYIRVWKLINGELKIISGAGIQI